MLLRCQCIVVVGSSGGSAVAAGRLPNENNISALNWGYIIELNMEESVCEGRKAEILMMKERYLI